MSKDVDETKNNEVLICSFCGKNQREVKKLIAGPGVNICDECVSLCASVVENETASEGFDFTKLSMKPKDIFDTINEYVIGQENAKKVLEKLEVNEIIQVEEDVARMIAKKLITK